MPARQGRLNTKYFTSTQKSPSQNASSSQRAGSRSHQKSGRSTQLAAGGSSSQDEGKDEDSEGSEAMAAIRLIASPSKRKGSPLLPEDIEVVDIVSDEEIVERAASGANDYADVTVLGHGEEDSDGIEEVEMPTRQPSSANGRVGKDATEAVPPNSASISTGARTRVAISNSSAANPVVPVPTSFTRLRTIEESTATPAPTSGSSQLMIELNPLTDAQGAAYTMWQDPLTSTTRPASVDDVQVFIGADKAPETRPRPRTQVVFDVSDDGEEEEEAPHKKPQVKSLVKSRSQISVQIPSHRTDSTIGRSVRKEVNGSSNRKGRPTSAALGARGGEIGIKIGKNVAKGKSRLYQDVHDEEDEEEVPRYSKKAKGKRRADTPETDKSDDSDVPLNRTPAKHRTKRSAHQSAEPSISRRKERSPSQSQRELLDELELEDSHRFKTQSRLRAKGETAFQRNLRKLKAKKLGIIEPDTEEDDSTEDEDDTSDSAQDSQDGGRPHSDRSFIEDDGNMVPDFQLPAQFSSNARQTPEWNFKVVFHYFLLLVIQGPAILPLKGENQYYMMPQLEALRRKLRDFRESRVRSQIWPRNYVNALQAFPRYKTEMLEDPEEHCLACNRHNYKSRFRLRLGGSRYDPNTYRPLESDKNHRQNEARRQAKKAKTKAKTKKRKAAMKKRRQNSATPSGSEFNSSASDSYSGSDSDFESESDDEDVIKRVEEILLGTHCQKRSHIYHQLTHWGMSIRTLKNAEDFLSHFADGKEFHLWNRVKNLHHDLLRAKKQDIIDDSDASPTEEESGLSDDEIQLRKEKRRMRREQTRTRVRRLKSTQQLPHRCRNVDDVMEWMDSQDYYLPEFRYLEDLQEQSRRLELDRNKDE